jgi:ribosomal protein L7Ae-like RNA K-turn-binding protein
MSLDKKRGIVIIICLILLVGIVNAAWIFFYYNQTITGNVIGGEKLSYTLLEFGSTLSVNTSEGASSNSTIMKINSLSENQNVKISIKVNKTNLNSSCSNYENDCEVFLSQVLLNGTRDTLVHVLTSTNTQSKSFTLLEGNNQIEYNLSCDAHSCPQTIVANITIEQD